MGRKKKKNKSPKAKQSFLDQLQDKDIRKDVDVNAYKTENPVWQIGKIDNEGAWGWKNIGRERWEKDILPKLQNFETMTWAEIEQQSGGKNRGTNHHPIPVEDMCKEAQKRLQDLNLDDVDELFSLRLRGRPRIFGIRNGRIMKLMWFDFDHQVCPSRKKHT